MKIFRPIFFLFALCLIAQAQDAYQKINFAVESRDYKTAISDLQRLQKSDKKIFEANNYDYLLARLAERSGNFGLAMSNYQKIVQRNSVLSEYALWHLAEIARSSGNLVLERNYLRELSVKAPITLLKNATSTRLARSYFESKDYTAAIQLLSSTTESNSQNGAALKPNQAANDPKTRDRLVLLGQSYLQSGKANEAREIFTQLVTKLPNPSQPDDFALQGAIGLDELDGGKDNLGKTAPQLADAEHLRRAIIYQFNRSFALARLHYQAIVERYPQSPNMQDALYQIGRGYFQDGSYNEAIPWFERLYTQYPDSLFAKDSLSQAASAYARLNKPKEAVDRYQKIIEKFPDSDNIERSYLNIVDTLRDAGNDSEALKWTAKTRETFKGELPETLALFAQVRIKISQGNWQGALSDLEVLKEASDLGGTRVPAGTNKNEVAFLRAFSLQQLGKNQEAIDAYLAIPDGRGEYYGGLATERVKALIPVTAALLRLKTLNLSAMPPIDAQNAESIRQVAQSHIRLTNDEATRAKLLDVIRRTYALLPSYQKIPGGTLQEFGRKEVLKEKRSPGANYHQALADELLFLGLYDEGTPELETALREKLPVSAVQAVKNTVTGQLPPESLAVFSPDVAYTLAVFYNRGDIDHRAIGYIEPQWKNIPADYQIELIPRDQARLLYPAPYVDSLLRHAPQRGVDPRYALSIMRQESRFRADVKSVAAARGLMQFISTTSNQIAKELGKNNFRQDDLYHPDTAVLFGSQYLSNLFKQFPNQPPAVAASYNGGEINMARWLARSKSDVQDRYVSEIIFSQSKDYVYKVMANYRVYQIIYDENLRMRP